MKASELRLKNLLYVGKSIEVVSELSKTSIKFEGRQHLYNLNGEGTLVKPIPLTEEWLLEFGFEKLEFFESNAGIGYHEDIWKKDDLILWFYLGNFDACTINGEGEYIDVSQVHLLQNLYFALKNTELKKIEL